MTLTFTGPANPRKPVAERKKPGPRSGYEPRFAEVALGYTILGATNAGLAEMFGVSLEVITDWLVQFSDFRAAVDEGRTQADLRVAGSFYRRATGYNVTTTKVEQREVRDADGNVTGAVKVTTTTDAHVPADTNAAWRWLQLRRGWRLPANVELSVEDILHIAQLARAEAARRGLDYHAHPDESEGPAEPGGAGAAPRH